MLEASLRSKDGWDNAKKYAGKSASELATDCAQACANSKRSTLEVVRRYYERDVPLRLANEKQTLAKLTGWSMAEIDKMAEAGVTSGNVKPAGSGDVQVPDTRTWWQKLFGMTNSGSRRAAG